MCVQRNTQAHTHAHICKHASDDEEEEKKKKFSSSFFFFIVVHNRLGD